jgi:hypothetical protein
MKIQTNTHVPDSTYFRTGDAEPEINPDGSITIYDGNGSSRSWGRPGVTSTIVLDECDLVAIHVGFHHKHGGGQFWRYYTTDGTTTRQIEWKDLPDDIRQRVLEAHEENAPAWAKAPGKLRSQYRKPSLIIRTTYKLVEQLPNGRLVSLYDSETEYQLGKRLAEKAQDEHQGGYYSHPTPEQVLNLWESGDLVPARCYAEPKILALLECEIGGNIIYYANGKMASTYMTPTILLRTIEYQPAAQAA